MLQDRKERPLTSLLRLFLLLPFLVLVLVLGALGFPFALAALAVAAGRLDLALDRIALDLALELLGPLDPVELALDGEHQLAVLVDLAVLYLGVVALAAADLARHLLPVLLQLRGLLALLAVLGGEAPLPGAVDFRLGVLRVLVLVLVLLVVGGKDRDGEARDNDEGENRDEPVQVARTHRAPPRVKMGRDV